MIALHSGMLAQFMGLKMSIMFKFEGLEPERAEKGREAAFPASLRKSQSKKYV